MKEFTIVGAVLIPNRRMLRYHEEVGFYEVLLTAKQIASIQKKVGSGEKLKFNKEHSETILLGVRITQSFLLNSERRKVLPEYYNDLPDGTWMIFTEFDNETNFEAAKSNTNGFSFELPCSFVHKGKRIKLIEKFRRINGVSNLMTVNLIIHGGDITSTGRSEHSEGHFEVQQKNSNQKIGDIKIPTNPQWIRFSKKEKLKFLTVMKGNDLKKQDKLVLMHWLDIEENLISCIEHWNRDNVGNPRAFQIPI